MLLYMAFIDFGGRGETGAQRMPGKFLASLLLGKIALHVGRQRRLLDEACHLLVVEAL